MLCVLLAYAGTVRSVSCCRVSSRSDGRRVTGHVVACQAVCTSDMTAGGNCNDKSVTYASEAADVLAIAGMQAWANVGTAAAYGPAPGHDQSSRGSAREPMIDDPR